MNTDEVLRQCASLIDDMLAEQLVQHDINQIYINMHMMEMSKFMRELDQTPRAKKYLEHSCKPYWAELLIEKWKECHEAERVYKKADKHECGYIALKSRSKHLHWK